MTKRANHIGYINKQVGTDCYSWEVFKEGNKTMAVSVRKIPACKAVISVGGFCGHFHNLDEMWDTDETVENGKPFELTQNRGWWGKKYTVNYCEGWYETKKDAEAKAEQLRLKGYKEVFIVPIENG